MKTIKYLTCCLILFCSTAHSEPKAAIENINIDEGFLTTIYDISYAFDQFTLIYDSEGQLRSIKQLKNARFVELFLRKRTSAADNNTPDRLLDKIIYYSK